MGVHTRKDPPDWSGWKGSATKVTEEHHNTSVDSLPRSLPDGDAWTHDPVDHVGDPVTRRK